MKSNISKYYPTIILTIIIFLGFWFRYSGILSNHSFWADESFTSDIARRIITGKYSMAQGISLVKYQPIQILSLIYSFKIFGYSELSARLFSVFWGSLGIFFCYLITKNYSNKFGGLLSAFIYSIFQINLANSTQAKPYASIQTLLLIVIYLVLQLSKTKKTFIFHVAILLTSSLALMIHNLGVIVLIPYITYIVFYLIKSKQKIKVFAGLLIGLVIFSSSINIFYYLQFITTPKFNNTQYLFELLWRQYGLFTLSAFFGLFLIKDKIIFLGTLFTILFLIYSWNFTVANHDLRYLTPLFGIMIFLFGVFWAKSGEVMYKRTALVCFIVALAIYIGGYKVARKPMTYYSPNYDFSGDIQNADYKTFFIDWKNKYPDFEEYPILAGPFDSLSWYTDRYPTATFNKFTKEPTYHPEFGNIDYAALSDFIDQVKKYPKGFVMIHDWESFMPQDIKDYVKKNMKLELRVEAMEVSPNDKWPLELYSWGFDSKK